MIGKKILWIVGVVVVLMIGNCNAGKYITEMIDAIANRTDYPKYLHTSEIYQQLQQEIKSSINDFSTNNLSITQHAEKEFLITLSKIFEKDEPQFLDCYIEKIYDSAINGSVSAKEIVVAACEVSSFDEIKNMHDKEAIINAIKRRMQHSLTPPTSSVGETDHYENEQINGTEELKYSIEEMIADIKYGCMSLLFCTDEHKKESLEKLIKETLVLLLEQKIGQNIARQCISGLKLDNRYDQYVMQLEELINK
jgi:hypothetical protein